MKDCWKALRLFVWMTLVTGLIYPFLITGIAQLTMKKEANGDFVEKNGNLVGSHLIGQKFEDEKYFWPRPSAIDYHPLPSGGSHLGPISSQLKEIVEERRKTILKFHSEDKPIPSELLYASGSGLDPHISLATAQFQCDRIIKARNWDRQEGQEQLDQLLNRFTQRRRFIFFEPDYLNVLSLNLALDKIDSNKINK